MTKKCIYCKKRSNPTVSRSFHAFPKNDQERAKKWISALHLTKTPNFNTSYVCSDHFKEQDFNDTGQQKYRRRLKLDAIPSCTSSGEVWIVSTTPNSNPPVAVLMNNTYYNNHEINSSLNRETDVVDSNQSNQVTFSDVKKEECLLNNNVSSDGAPRSVYNKVPLASSSQNAGPNEDTTQKSINHKRRRKWLELIGRDDLIERLGHLKTAPNHYKVCEEHFEEHCFKQNFRLDNTPNVSYKSVKFLSTDAMPTLKLRITKGNTSKGASQEEQCKTKVTRCSYYGCHNTSEQFTMFRFPCRKSQQARLATWLQNAGNSTLTRLSIGQLRRRFLCEVHFDKSCIEAGSDKPVLTKEAVPLKTLLVMKPVKVYTKRGRIEQSPEASPICDESGDVSGDDDLDDEFVASNTHSISSSDQIHVEIEKEPTADRNRFKTMLCIEVPPLISSSAHIQIKAEPDNDSDQDSSAHIQIKAEPDNDSDQEMEPSQLLGQEIKIEPFTH